MSCHEEVRSEIAETGPSQITSQQQLVDEILSQLNHLAANPGHGQVRRLENS